MIRKGETYESENNNQPVRTSITPVRDYVRLPSILAHRTNQFPTRPNISIRTETDHQSEETINHFDVGSIGQETKTENKPKSDPNAYLVYKQMKKLRSQSFNQSDQPIQQQTIERHSSYMLPQIHLLNSFSTKNNINSKQQQLLNNSSESNRHLQPIDDNIHQQKRSYFHNYLNQTSLAKNRSQSIENQLPTQPITFRQAENYFQTQSTKLNQNDTTQKAELLPNLSEPIQNTFPSYAIDSSKQEFKYDDLSLIDNNFDSSHLKNKKSETIFNFPTSKPSSFEQNIQYYQNNQMQNQELFETIPFNPKLQQELLGEQEPQITQFKETTHNKLDRNAEKQSKQLFNINSPKTILAIKHLGIDMQEFEQKSKQEIIYESAHILENLLLPTEKSFFITHQFEQLEQRREQMINTVQTYKNSSQFEVRLSQIVQLQKSLQNFKISNKSHQPGNRYHTPINNPQNKNPTDMVSIDDALQKLQIRRNRCTSTIQLSRIRNSSQNNRSESRKTRRSNNGFVKMRQLTINDHENSTRKYDDIQLRKISSTQSNLINLLSKLDTDKNQEKFSTITEQTPSNRENDLGKYEIFKKSIDAGKSDLLSVKRTSQPYTVVDENENENEKGQVNSLTKIGSSPAPKEKQSINGSAKRSISHYINDREEELNNSGNKYDELVLSLQTQDRFRLHKFKKIKQEIDKQRKLQFKRELMDHENEVWKQSIKAKHEQIFSGAQTKKKQYLQEAKKKFLEEQVSKELVHDKKRQIDTAQLLKKDLILERIEEDNQKTFQLQQLKQSLKSDYMKIREEIIKDQENNTTVHYVSPSATGPRIIFTKKGIESQNRLNKPNQISNQNKQQKQSTSSPKFHQPRLRTTFSQPFHLRTSERKTKPFDSAIGINYQSFFPILDFSSIQYITCMNIEKQKQTSSFLQSLANLEADLIEKPTTLFKEAMEVFVKQAMEQEHEESEIKREYNHLHIFD